MKHPHLLLMACALASPLAQAATVAFDANPAANSTDWTTYVTTHGGVINTALDFESHPLGALDANFYAAQGVHMALSGANITFNEVYDYRNNYGGTTSGYGPNSSGEGLANESRAYSAFSPNHPWNLTLSFDAPVLGAGLFVIDLFNGLGDRPVSLAAYDGVDGTGNLLATAHAPTYNFQLYYQFFLGVASDTANIRSVVFTNAPGKYGDGIVLDDIRFAQPVPEPETYALMLVGLGLVGFAARRMSN